MRTASLLVSGPGDRRAQREGAPHLIRVRHAASARGCAPHLSTPVGRVARSGGERESRPMSRLTGSRVLIGIGTLLAFLSILAVWISRQVLETDQWTTTSSEVLQQKAVQRQVAGFLVDQLYANVDIQGELRDALPGRLALLAGPASGAIRQGADTVARRALSNARVQGLWEDANRAAHAELVELVLHGG